MCKHELIASKAGIAKMRINEYINELKIETLSDRKSTAPYSSIQLHTAPVSGCKILQEWGVGSGIVELSCVRCFGFLS